MMIEKRLSATPGGIYTGDKEDPEKKKSKRRKVIYISLTVAVVVIALLSIAIVSSTRKIQPSPTEDSTASIRDSNQENRQASPTGIPIRNPDGTINSTETQEPDIPTETRERFKYTDIGFDWLDPSNWEWADGSPMTDATHKFTSDRILVDRTVRRTAFRTRKGWAGRKIIYTEWIATASSDTNIWMLNTKINPQFGHNNGWPFYGELDLFEMFTADAALHPEYDFSGFQQFSNVASYGQLTFHFGGASDAKQPCFCPSSHSKNVWYQSQSPLTSSCTAQFANTPGRVNRLATIFETDGDGQYIQLIQNPIIVPGAENTYDVRIGPDSVATPRIFNNANFFWGIPAGECTHGEHNPQTGFPFFETFRFIVEEQGNGQFELLNLVVLTP